MEGGEPQGSALVHRSEDEEWTERVWLGEILFKMYLFILHLHFNVIARGFGWVPHKASQCVPLSQSGDGGGQPEATAVQMEVINRVWIFGKGGYKHPPDNLLDFSQSQSPLFVQP